MDWLMGVFVTTIAQANKETIDRRAPDDAYDVLLK
jgi:chemotaxis protein CheY-P-specific phosphatase CheC